jgi:hypothetical protein
MPQTFTLTPSDGSDALTLTVPTSWGDVTLATYLRLLTEPDALAVLLGLDSDTVGRIAADDAVYLVNALAFTADHGALAELEAEPGLLDVGTGPYSLLMLATQHIESLPDNTPGLVAAPYLFALYRCQQLYGKVDEAKVEAMRLAVLQEPVQRVYANCHFFIKGWRRSTSGTSPKKMNGSNPKKRNWKQALRSLVSGSAPSSRSTRRPNRSA